MKHEKRPSSFFTKEKQRRHFANEARNIPSSFFTKEKQRRHFANEARKKTKQLLSETGFCEVFLK